MNNRVMDTPQWCTEVSKQNFASEVRNLAAFYEDRIPLDWQDALQNVLDTIEKETDDAAD